VSGIHLLHGAFDPGTLVQILDAAGTPVPPAEMQVVLSDLHAIEIGAGAIAVLFVAAIGLVKACSEPFQGGAGRRRSTTRPRGS
jgi:hypothetical protein